MTDGLVERVMAAGTAAVLAGEHLLEADRAITRRWGLSSIIQPSGALERSLDAISTEVLYVAGSGHWRSGRAGCAHLTVRALERYEAEPTPDARLARYTAAIERACREVGPIHLEFRGLVLSTAGVLAVARSSDGTADDLRARLGIELGPDGWLEDQVFRKGKGRDPIWYCSLLHFAGPVSLPHRLVEWVEERSALELGDESFTTIVVCRWAFDGAAMRPVPLVSVGVP